jgi:hypothetical protein
VFSKFPKNARCEKKVMQEKVFFLERESENQKREEKGVFRKVCERFFDWNCSLLL